VMRFLLNREVVTAQMDRHYQVSRKLT